MNCQLLNTLNLISIKFNLPIYNIEIYGYQDPSFLLVTLLGETVYFFAIDINLYELIRKVHKAKTCGKFLYYAKSCVK